MQRITSLKGRASRDFLSSFLPFINFIWGPVKQGLRMLFRFWEYISIATCENFKCMVGKKTPRSRNFSLLYLREKSWSVWLSLWDDFAMVLTPRHVLIRVIVPLTWLRYGVKTSPCPAHAPRSLTPPCPANQGVWLTPRCPGSPRSFMNNFINLTLRYPIRHTPADFV